MSRSVKSVCRQTLAICANTAETLRPDSQHYYPGICVVGCVHLKEQTMDFVRTNSPAGSGTVR